MSLDLDKLTELEASATPGPWEADGLHRGVYVLNVDAGDVVEDPNGLPADAALIAAARNALPALINAVHDRDQQFILAKTALGALTAAEDVLNEAAALPPEHADNLDLRDETVLGLRAERDAARAEVAALRERVEAVLSEWGGDQPDDFAASFHEAIEDSGAWRFARDLRAALATGGDA